MTQDLIGDQLPIVEEHIKRGELREAAKVLNILAVKTLGDPRLHFAGAMLARAANNMPACIQSLERSLDIEPTWVLAHVERIRAMSNMGNNTLALAASKEALELCGDSLPLLEVASAAAEAEGAFAVQQEFLNRALALSPNDVSILNAVALSATRVGDNSHADAMYQRAREQEPDNLVAVSGAAMLALQRGDHAKAVTDFEHAATLAPSDEFVAFNLAVARGDKPTRMPDTVAQAVFDNYAARFDRHLVGVLQYKLPRQVAELLQARYPDRKMDVLDLGCGTGLLGAYLGPIRGALVGVDLSARMIAEAAKHGLYHRFHNISLLDALSHTPADQYDVITALDVFIYVGDVTEAISNAHNVLRPGGVLVFSCETATAEEGDLVLRDTFRYAHSESAIRAACVKAGFTPVTIEAIELRTEHDKPVAGFLCIAEKSR